MLLNSVKSKNKFGGININTNFEAMFKTEIRIKDLSLVERMKKLISRRKQESRNYSMNDWIGSAIENEIKREEKIIQKHN